MANIFQRARANIGTGQGFMGTVRSIFNPRQGGMQAPVGAGMGPQQHTQANQTLGMNLGPMQGPEPPPRIPTQPAPQPAGPQLTTTAPRIATIQGMQGFGATPEAQFTQQQTDTSGMDEEAAMQQAFLDQLHNQYQSGMGFLGNLEAQLRGEMPRIQQGIQDRFDPLRQTLQTSREQALGQLGTQREDAERQRQNAMAEARAMFNELQMGQRARFGGGTGTGQFAGELQGREFARQTGRIGDTAAQNMRDLQQREQEVQQNFENSMMQVESQANQALEQAQQELQERLRAIDASRFELGQNKAQQRLQALQEFNANRQAINQQKQQFQQQLAAQTLAAQQNIFSAVQQSRANMGAPVDLQGLPGAQFSTLQGQQQTAGQDAPQGRRLEDLPLFNPSPLFREEEETV